MSDAMTPLFGDLKLARRLEDIEAAANAAAAEAEARRNPAGGACWEKIAGGRAMFLGVGSIITQAFGVGTNGAVSDAEWDRLEEFFRSRGSAVPLEICSLADKSVFELLGQRGYRPIELSSVLVRRVEEAQRQVKLTTGTLEITRIAPKEQELWSRTVVEGFCGPDYPPEMLHLMGGMCSTRNAAAYLAKWDGVAAGGCACSITDSVMIFYGDATIAAHRGRGIQAALIAERLAEAARQGCELAMAVTECGSISQRNYERVGFRVMYTRTKYLREWK